jgi:hypothetical protein
MVAVGDVGVWKDRRIVSYDCKLVVSFHHLVGAFDKHVYSLLILVATISATRLLATVHEGAMTVTCMTHRQVSC